MGISARHCHVTPKVLEQLYGQGFRLSVKKYIKQPQQFASNQRVKFVSDSGVEMKLSIVGPCRAYTQIEISATDARTLGIPAIVRESGNTKGSPGGKLVGPAGEVKLDEGAIVVARHIHISEETANKYQLKQGDRVKIRVEGPRSATLDNVLVRAGLEDFDEVHLDTDESNALFVKSDDIVTIIIDDD
ncbi:MAG: propanediol utilization protein [Acidaminococcaceae bacterium]|nr:propanediol utilization protein [Acidaminococcaceae bacterium]